MAPSGRETIGRLIALISSKSLIAPSALLPSRPITTHYLNWRIFYCPDWLFACYPYHWSTPAPRGWDPLPLAELTGVTPIPGLFRPLNHFLRCFGAKTTWCLQSHRVWARLRLSVLSGVWLLSDGALVRPIVIGGFLRKLKAQSSSQTIGEFSLAGCFASAQTTKSPSCKDRTLFSLYTP